MKLVRSAFAAFATAAAVFGVPSAAWAAAPETPEALRISESAYSGFQQCFTATPPTVGSQFGPQFSASPAGSAPQPGLMATLEIARPGEEPFLRRTEATWPSGSVWGFTVSPGTFTPGSYEFRMRAENSEGVSAWSDWCGFTVTGTAPTDTAYSPDGGEHCLGVKDSGTADGTPVRLEDCTGAPGQAWRVDEAAGTLVNSPSGKCLDVAGGLTFSGTRVQLYSCNGTGAQKWLRDKPSAGSFLNSASGKCLDVRLASFTAGTPVQIYTCNGTGAQTWSQHALT